VRRSLTPEHPKNAEENAEDGKSCKQKADNNRWSHKAEVDPIAQMGSPQSGKSAQNEPRQECEDERNNDALEVFTGRPMTCRCEQRIK